MNNKTAHHWQFQRLGSSNQVLLETGEDIAELSNLDPKLWMTLSCPTTGLEFDQDALKLLDKTGEKRIRISEVLEATDWLKLHLKDLSSLINSPESISFDNLTETAEGKKALVTAQAILNNLNLTNQNTISLDEIKQSKSINSSRLYNGDGIFPAAKELPEAMQNWINLAMEMVGSVDDASGAKGIDLNIANALVSYVKNYSTWEGNLHELNTAFKENTSQLWRLTQELKPKIDDYFLRTYLASYAPQAQVSLNVDEKSIVPMENGILNDTQLAELPLAKIESDKPLNLKHGINPVWKDKIEKFAVLCAPFLAQPDELTHDEWETIQAKLAPYEKVILAEPTLAKVTTKTAPTMTFSQLTQEQVTQILDPNLLEEFTKMVNQDLSTPISTESLLEIERLATYHHHFYRFLCNFVSFSDFYLRKKTAIFQAGNLYLDSRCCHLCAEVTDIAKHSVLATYSSLYLIYCTCTRKKPTGDPVLDNKTIVAAMTAGDSLFLVEGRNGLYIDNFGDDWDATIVKIISNAISLRQAILDPYRRIGHFITEQINKWASDKDNTMMSSATAKIAGAAPAEGTKFDIAKSAGIFAAIGLALGALGTAIASIASSLFALHWWQIPLVFLGIFLIISGPSVILAWLKLRNRTLAPLLEASGWAINSNMKINFYLGSQLTSEAKLPKNANLDMSDPTKKGKSKYYLLLLVFFIFIGSGIYCAWN